MKHRVWLGVLAVAVVTAAGAWALRSRRGGGPPGAGEHVVAAAAGGPVTFNRDVAPIIFAHCTTCHRPGEAGPFNLASYSDVRKRASQVAEVTQRRYMPPWLPAPGHGEFVEERRLTDAQIAVIGEWVRQGAPEGDAADLPPVPQFPQGWKLGPPDLLVTLPEPYELPAEAPSPTAGETTGGGPGGDVYRNFVIPVPPPPPGSGDATRYVRAVEMRPGNPKVVHHAFLLVDAEGGARALDAADPEPGYGGMSAGDGVVSPAGQFLSWQPGKVNPEVSAPGAGGGAGAWPLRAGEDLVLQMHLRPSGKVERVQPSVALYLTDQPPRGEPLKLVLRSLRIDIPPGATDYAVEDRYVLPVAVEVLAVLPHAHYLGKELSGWAELPDRSRRWLIHIPQWDFNWQGHYTFRQPLRLPAGTALRMRYTYDNSDQNPRNPNNPPLRVKSGQRTADEMGELWLLVRAYSRGEEERLKGDYYRKWVLPDAIVGYERALERAPDDPKALVDLARGVMEAGRSAEAEERLKRAVELKPDYARAHYYLGVLYSEQGSLRAAAAKQSYAAAIAADPTDVKSLNNLGLLLLKEGKVGEAEGFFRNALDQARALEAKAADSVKPGSGRRAARTHVANACLNLGLAAFAREDLAGAAAHFEQALKSDPDHAGARSNLEKVRARLSESAPK
jgi:Tfp pilus assembly protein PilF